MRRVILCVSMVVWLGAQAQAADPSSEAYPTGFTVERTLFILWPGTIRSGMESGIRVEFDRAKADSLIATARRCRRAEGKL